MHIDELAMIRALVPVAWADGSVGPQERAMLDALLDAFEASADEKAALFAYATERRTVDDIDLQSLSTGDRRLLLQHAVLMSFADGKQEPSEVLLLGELANRLRIPPDEAKQVVSLATERAKKNLGLL
jgi:tellurite resistance protein